MTPSQTDTPTPRAAVPGHGEDVPTLYLKKREERRVYTGHPWVYSNEVDVSRGPFAGLRAGEPVAVCAHGGKRLGYGYVNPHALICVRLFSRTQIRLTRALVHERVARALAWRQRLYETPHYRLVYGESDGLPGLTVDRYGDALVAQLTTAGIECLRDDVVDVLVELLQPATLILRNDTPARSLEGLDTQVECVLGEAPECLEVGEAGATFRVPALRGQKTGWFFDQRPNRLRLGAYVKGRRVLDVFSYCGGFAIHGALAGAREVLAIDSSAGALERVGSNAELNGVADKVATLQGDALKLLKTLGSDRERFDVIVLDPPAFIRRKKDWRNGMEAYQRLNRMALNLLDEDGVLVSASCSSYLGMPELRNLLHRAARSVGREARIIEQGHQGPDHPVHPGLPESDYLKALFAHVP